MVKLCWSLLFCLLFTHFSCFNVFFQFSLLCMNFALHDYLHIALLLLPYYFISMAKFHYTARLKSITTILTLSFYNLFFFICTYDIAMPFFFFSQIDHYLFYSFSFYRSFFLCSVLSRLYHNVIISLVKKFAGNSRVLLPIFFLNNIDIYFLRYNCIKTLMILMHFFIYLCTYKSSIYIFACYSSSFVFQLHPSLRCFAAVLGRYTLQLGVSPSF